MYLEETYGNLSLALKNISHDIRPIGIIKCRFSAVDVNIYGLLLLIFNARTKKMLRHAAVSGCTPEIFEVDINSRWFSFEKKLYSSRLKDGALREITQKIEQSVLLEIQREKADNFYACWNAGDGESIKVLLKDTIQEVITYDTGRKEDVYLEFNCQNLNLRQFKYLMDADRIDELPLHLEEEKTYSSLVVLDTELVRNASEEIKASLIEAGDAVYTKIIDERDIGIYLSYLLGGRKGDEMMPLSANVEDVKILNSNVEIVVRFGPGIIGRAIVDARKKVGIIKNKGVRSYKWFYFLIAAGGILMYYVIKGF